ncbi:hypothetical protein ACFE04_012509 [Oxalis oulophora]
MEIIFYVGVEKVEALTLSEAELNNVYVHFFAAISRYSISNFTKASPFTDSNAVQQGKQIHTHLFKFGFVSDGFSLNNLIHMYVNFQSLDEAKKVFRNMDNR